MKDECWTCTVFHASYNYRMAEDVLYTLVQCSVCLLVTLPKPNCQQKFNNRFQRTEAVPFLIVAFVLAKARIESYYLQKFIHVNDSAILSAGISSMYYIFSYR